MTPKRLATIEKSQRNIARITKAAERNASISETRLRIERLLQKSGPLGLTVQEIARRLRLDNHTVSSRCSSMHQLGSVYKGDQSRHNKTRWVWHTNKPANTTPKEAPIHPGNQPIGSTEYWAEFMRKVNTPARVELLGGWSPRSGGQHRR
jgi:predicted transcriptional regulator